MDTTPESEFEEWPVVWGAPGYFRAPEDEHGNWWYDVQADPRHCWWVFRAHGRERLSRVYGEVVWDPESRILATLGSIEPGDTLRYEPVPVAAALMRRTKER